MSCRSPRSSAAGFSLIELTIVMLVLAIGAALAVPSFRGQDTTKLRSAARLLAADLDAAKTESITHADDLRVVVFDTDNATYHIAAASDTATPVTNPYDRRPYRVDFGTGRASALTGVTIQSIDLDGDNELGFGLYGELDQTAAATVTLAAGEHTVTLTVDPATGEATIGAIH